MFQIKIKKIIKNVKFIHLVTRYKISVLHLKIHFNIKFIIFYFFKQMSSEFIICTFNKFFPAAVGVFQPCYALLYFKIYK